MDGFGGLQRPSPQSGQGEESRRALAALIAPAAAVLPRDPFLPAGSGDADYDPPPPNNSGPVDAHGRGGEFARSGDLSPEVGGPSGASSAIGFVDGGVGVSRVLELGGGTRVAGGMSLDGTRRPHDGLFPSFVGGGRSGDRDYPGPQQTIPTARWPSAHRGRGVEASLSTDLQDFAPFRDEAMRPPAEQQAGRGASYEHFEEDSRGRYAQVAPTGGGGSIPPPLPRKFEVYPERRGLDVQPATGEGGMRGFVTLFRETAIKIDEESSRRHALDKERMLEETRTIPMGGEEGDSLTLVRVRGIEGEDITKTPLPGGNQGNPAQGQETRIKAISLPLGGWTTLRPPRTPGQGRRRARGLTPPTKKTMGVPGARTTPWAPTRQARATQGLAEL